MSKGRNKIIAGCCEDSYIFRKKLNNKNYLNCSGVIGFILPNKIKSYEVITEEAAKSGDYSIARGLVGMALFGGLGALAGSKSGEQGSHTIAVEMNSGDKFLMELDDNYYKIFIASMF